MLDISNLSVKINNKDILKDFNLHISKGEIHAIMGPNGTGKSTLSKVLLNDKRYDVCGNITFDGVDIRKLPTNEIANKGIFLANQLPCEIDGVTTADFLRTIINNREDKNISLYEFIKKIEKAQEELKMNKDMIHRSINKGFSGGEKKKNEILQMKILEPKLIILDEIDSGLDVDSLRIVSENVNNYIKENKDSSVLIITHYPRILEYIKPDYVHIMVDGNIKESGTYDLALKVEKDGYDSYKSSASIVGDEIKNE